MINSLILIIFKNTLFFSFIFWLLTFIFKYFYTNKNYTNKLNFYECGFKSLSNIKIQYNINFMLLLLFVIIYDGEFILLIPFSLNISIINFLSLFLIFIFCIFFIFTILVDFIFNSLDWQI